MFLSYFSPPSEEIFSLKSKSASGTIGSVISVFDGNVFPNLG